WIEAEGKLEHVYDLRHAVSNDGIHWQRHAKAAIPQADPEEALTRPTLLSRLGDWWMWFSYRGSRGFRAKRRAYRIGFARSAYLVQWGRDDRRAGIDVSAEGWDSQMITYPCVVQTPAGLVMFYNGNGFGQEGFGYAVWET